MSIKSGRGSFMSVKKVGRGSFMAAKDREREYDFVEQPPEEFFCPVSFAVLLEPYQTQCCANQLSQETYQRLQGQPCPVCREENLAAMKDNFHKRRVFSLKVRCPHKAEGCEWQGELRGLEQHLNTNSSAGECRYVDVDCPYACGERVQRRSLEEHKSQRCPLRPFTCQYCNHKATHQKVTKEHWPVCEKYPLPCPNECGEGEIERQHLKGHLEQTCPLEVIQCDFSYAGCGAQLQRRLMSAHMKEGMEAHLSLLSLVVPNLQTLVQQQGDLMKQMRDQSKQQGDQIKQQGDLIKQMRDQSKQDRDQMKQQGDQIKQQGDQQGDQIKQQGDQMKQQGDQMKQQGYHIKQQGDQIKQQGDLIKQMRDQIKLDREQDRDQIKQQGDLMIQMRDQMKQMENRIKQLEKPFPPVDIIMDDFEKHKKSNDIWFSRPFYTHHGGYKMCLMVDANGVVGGKGTPVSVLVHLMRGEFDDFLKWPFRGDVTIQLKKTDPPHYQMIRSFDNATPDRCVCKPPTKGRNLGWGYYQYISLADLYAGGYLKDDKLVFCVSDIVVKSK